MYRVNFSGHVYVTTPNPPFVGNARKVRPFAIFSLFSVFQLISCFYSGLILLISSFQTHLLTMPKIFNTNSYYPGAALAFKLDMKWSYMCMF